MRIEQRILLGILPILIGSTIAVVIVLHGFAPDAFGFSRLVVAVLVVGVLLACILTVLGVRRTTRPLRELTELLARVRQGDFDVTFDVEGPREIEELAEAFNHMTRELERNRATLEQRVTDRTRRIQAINNVLRAEIEERRQAERALRRSEERYRTLVEQSVEAIYVADADTWEVIEANPAFRRMTGYADTDDLNLADFIVRDEEEVARDIERVVENGSIPMVDSRWETTDGEQLDVGVTASVLEHNERDTIFVVARDMTERKRLQSKLELTERLASLGTLASGIAHEINNPLSFVVTNLYFLRDEIERVANEENPSPDFDEWLDVIEQSERGASRMQKVVHDLRSFYRTEDDQTGPVDIRGVFEMVLGLATADLPPSVEVVEDWGDVSAVSANKGTLGQVFLNIVVNAMQALPEDRNGRQDRITVQTYQPNPETVCIEISDTGEGIPEEHRDRIFDPFFTTKPVDVGTGLGLSMCHSIITSFGGLIDVESEVGEGTTFRILLPSVLAESNPKLDLHLKSA